MFLHMVNYMLLNISMSSKTNILFHFQNIILLKLKVTKFSTDLTLFRTSQQFRIYVL